MCSAGERENERGAENTNKGDYLLNGTKFLCLFIVHICGTFCWYFVFSTNSECCW